VRLLAELLGLGPARRPRGTASSRLFLSAGTPTAEYVDVEEVEWLGVKTSIYVTAMRTVYVIDEVELPREALEGLDDRTAYSALSRAEAEMARRGVDPYASPKEAVAIIEGKLRGRLRERAGAAAALLYRWYYAYGTITPLLLSRRLGITDVLVTLAGNYVEVESHRYGAGLATNLELADGDREHLRDVISRRVVPLSAARPFASRYDEQLQVRVTAIVPDVAPRPAYAFRVMNVTWTAPLFVAMGGAEPWQMAYLCAQWRRYRHVLAVGTPGSGKTSLINAVLSCTQTKRRLAIIQSVPELRVPQASFIATERHAFGAGISEVLMADLVQKFGLRANSDVGINELLTEADTRAFVTVAFAGFGAAATLHATDVQEVLLRLRRLGVSEAELEALLPRLYIPVMRREVTERGVRRRVAAIYAPRDGRHEPVTEGEALEDPEVREWARIIAEAARSPALWSPEAWVSYLRQFD